MTRRERSRWKQHTYEKYLNTFVVPVVVVIVYLSLKHTHNMYVVDVCSERLFRANETDDISPSWQTRAHTLIQEGGQQGDVM